MKKLLFLLTVMAVVGCGKSDDTEKPSPPSPTPTPQPTPTSLYCNTIPDEVVMGCRERTARIYLDSNVPVKDFVVSSDAAWCDAKVLDEQGAENTVTLQLTCEDYSRMDGKGQAMYDPPRMASVSIKAGNVKSATMKVVQESDIKLVTDVNYLPGEVLRLSPMGATADVKVLTNCYRWTVSTDADWLTVEKKNEGTISVTSKARQASVTAPRTAKVTVMSTHFIEGLSPTMVYFTVADTDADLNGETYSYDDETTPWD